MEEWVYLEEVLEYDEQGSAPVRYARLLWSALKIVFIAVGISVAAALLTIGALSVWLYAMLNT
jgi:hypothetical protein